MTEGIGKLRGVDLENALDGLIHPGVTTPRHVIRLLNEFNGDLRLAQRREGALNNVGEEVKPNLLGAGAITNNLPFLAVATAIREDFAQFHTDLAHNPELIQVIEKGMSGDYDSPDTQDLDEQFVGYREICANYFALVPTPEKVTEDTVPGPINVDTSRGINWSQPFPAYRDLVLHLQATRRFRAAVVAPFVFFREDVAARRWGVGAGPRHGC